MSGLIKTTKDVQKTVGSFIEKTPRDVAISLLSTSVLKDLKEWATNHLLSNCADCDKYISTDGESAVIKVVKKDPVYDDEELRKLELQLEKIKAKIAARKMKIEPTHYVESRPFFRSTKP